MAKYNILIAGQIGTGKTYSVRTLVEAGVETFVLATEPGAERILGDIPCEKGLHLAYVPPATIDWETMIRNAQVINMSSMESLQKMIWPNRSDYNQWLLVLGMLANFKCNRCGNEFGAVDSWDEKRAIVLDGLSNLSKMSRHLTVGAKPIMTLPEWGVAQESIRWLVDKLCNDTKCNFVLFAHLEREKDELTGGTSRKVSTLGNKLAPDLVKPFDEVIMSKHENNKFVWSTAEGDAELKTRCLGWRSDIAPTFTQFPMIGKEGEVAKESA